MCRLSVMANYGLTNKHRPSIEEVGMFDLEVDATLEYLKIAIGG